MLRASRAVEEAGVPAFAIVSTGFLRQARATARALGIPDIELIEYPGVIPNDSDDQFHQKVRSQIIPHVLRLLELPEDR